MNVNDDTMRRWLQSRFNETQRMFENILGPSETLAVTDTLQWDDYSPYVSDGTDENHKKLARKNKFPLDLEAAYDLGKRFAS